MKNTYNINKKETIHEINLMTNFLVRDLKLKKVRVAFIVRNLVTEFVLMCVQLMVLNMMSMVRGMIQIQIKKNTQPQEGETRRPGVQNRVCGEVHSEDCDGDHFGVAMILKTMVTMAMKMKKMYAVRMILREVIGVSLWIL